jgi:flagellin-like protein
VEVVISPRIKFKKKWSDNKGVSEIIGTILMLAITVVLFSSIMVFVTNMPTPIARPTADFLSSLTYNTTTNSGTVTLTHNGGEALNDYETQLLVIVDGNIRLTPRTMAAGGLGSTWKIGQKWTCWLPSLGATNSLEIMVVDLHSNSQVWDGKISAGAGNNAPVILQRWTDSDTSTLTADPIIEGDVGFSLFVRVTDADNNLLNVTVDASSIGSGSNKGNYSINAGVWEFKFTNSITQASLFDGRPLLIKAKDRSTPANWANATFLLTVSASERGPQGQQGPPGPPADEVAPGEEGLPSYLVYVHGDQGYVVLGEDESRRNGSWGQYANTSEPKFNFTQGEEWIFIRIGSKNVKNLDAKNTITVRNIFSNTIVSSVSSDNAFSLLTVSGPAYIYQDKFNSSYLSPGAYSVFIDLLSTATEGSSPSRFQASFVLTIDSADESAPPVFVPTIKIFKEDRRVNPLATEWGINKTESFDLSEIGTSIMWVEVVMQDVGAASSALIQDVKISDMRGRTNLYGNPPVLPNMMSAISRDTGLKTYYFSIDLRFKNGVTYSASLSSYNIGIGKIADSNEGVYSLSTPIWIKYSVQSNNYVIATSGFGFDSSGSSTFIHSDYLFQTDNNKFFTTRILDGMDGNPGSGDFNVYKTIYFDIDEDGDRDILTAQLINSQHQLCVFINRLNEYGIWEPRTIFSNYTDNKEIYSMANGDVDGDGDQDWIISTIAGKVTLYINDFPIRTKTVLATGSGFFCEMRLVDVTGDGRADLVAIGSLTGTVVRGATGCKLYMYKNITTTPVLMANVPTSNFVYDFDMGDIDFDGDLDVALTSADSASSSNRGVRWFNRTEGLSSALARSDVSTTPPAGRSGTFNDTQSSNNVYEILTEVGGTIEHIWSLSTISGEKPTLSVELKLGSSTDESFYFSYSTDAIYWTLMFVVPQTTSSITDSTFTFELPSSTPGTIYVKLKDSSASGSHDDSVFVDLLTVRGISSVAYNVPANGYQVLGDYNNTCIGIGDANDDGNLDIAVGLGVSAYNGTGTFKIILIKQDGSGQRSAYYTESHTNLNPDGDTFAFKDVNGDGLADVVSVIYKKVETSPNRYGNTILFEWLNLGVGSTFEEVLIKDFHLSYGNKGGRVINSIAIENPYG